VLADQLDGPARPGRRGHPAGDPGVDPVPAELSATLDRSTWTPAPVFDLVRQVGAVPLEDLEMTLNCGVGMVAVVAADAADEAVRVLAEHDVRAWVAGEVTPAPGGEVGLVGAYPGW
jgi:phosphoribosylformylglycinamidine cyclo-ligase